MAKKEKRVYDDDDGRVIAPMNVDGMPWYRREPVKKAGSKQEDKPEYQYTKDQRRFIILGAIKAGLVIGLAFIAVFFVFILLIWLVSKARYG